MGFVFKKDGREFGIYKPFKHQNILETWECQYLATGLKMSRANSLIICQKMALREYDILSVTGLWNVRFSDMITQAIENNRRAFINDFAV